MGTMDKELDGIEIPEALLEAVSGGVISPNSKALISENVKDWKSQGYALEDIEKLYSLLIPHVNQGEGDDFTTDEVLDFIKKVYNES